MNETTSNQQDFLKILQREIDYHTLVVNVTFNVDCFLCNLSEEKKTKRETDLLNFIVVVIFKRC